MRMCARIESMKQKTAVRFSVMVPRAEYEAIRANAAAAGESVSARIAAVIEARFQPGNRSQLAAVKTAGGVRATVFLRPETIKAAKQECARQKVSVSQAIAGLLTAK